MSMSSHGDVHGELDPEDIDRILPVLFLLKVWLLCRFEFRESPDQLLKRTIRGERDAILKVLRLDADIRSSKRFSPVVEEFVQNYSDAEMTCSHEPVTGFAPAGFSATGVKALVCGWIVSWSQLLEKAVPRLMKAFTNPDIRSLFDAIARDTTGKLRDEDLQTDDEAFRKMSRRYRKEFNVMWWDIFGVGIVPG